MSERFRFKIPIGDWSGDGHGQCDYYEATAAKPVEAAREAYFEAKKKHKKLCPENYCESYQDGSLPEDIKKALVAAGALPATFDWDTYTMAKIVVWFMNQGDASLDARLEPKNEVEMLAFYGKDKKKRHIGHIGYGMFA